MDQGYPEVGIEDLDLDEPTEEMLKNIDKLRELKALYITVCPYGLTAFPSALQRLILTEIQISEFPPQICDLLNLEYLEISLTQIESIPPEIARLCSLKNLDLSCNAIIRIAPELWSLDGLEFLALSYNERVFIPPEVTNMRSLQLLELSNIANLYVDPAITALDVNIRVGLEQRNHLHPAVDRMISRRAENETGPQPTMVTPLVFDAFPEDIPLSNDCSVCMNAEHLLILGCRHIVCLGCLPNLQSTNCPVCRGEIIKSLIKRKM